MCMCVGVRASEREGGRKRRKEGGGRKVRERDRAQVCARVGTNIVLRAVARWRRKSEREGERRKSEREGERARARVVTDKGGFHS